jgi:hypothetical protein
VGRWQSLSKKGNSVVAVDVDEEALWYPKGEGWGVVVPTVEGDCCPAAAKLDHDLEV